MLLGGEDAFQSYGSRAKKAGRASTHSLPHRARPVLQSSPVLRSNMLFTDGKTFSLNKIPLVLNLEWM